MPKRTEQKLDGEEPANNVALQEWQSACDHYISHLQRQVKLFDKELVKDNGQDIIDKLENK